MWSLSLRNGWTFRPLAYPAPKSTPPIPPGPGPLSWVILADVNPVVARQQHLSMSRGVWVQTVIAAHGTNALALPLHTGDIIEAIDEYPVASVDAVHAILQRPDHPGLSQFRIARNHRESTIRLGVAP